MITLAGRLRFAASGSGFGVGVGESKGAGFYLDTRSKITNVSLFGNNEGLVNISIKATNISGLPIGSALYSVNVDLSGCSMYGDSGLSVSYLVPVNLGNGIVVDAGGYALIVTTISSIWGSTGWDDSFHGLGFMSYYHLLKNSLHLVELGGGGWTVNPYFQFNFIVDGIMMPIVDTGYPTNILDNSATLNGYLNDDGGIGPLDCGFEWGETTAYGNTTPTTSQISGETFTQNIVGLIADKMYHYRAFAISSMGTSYGTDMVFVAHTFVPGQTICRINDCYARGDVTASDDPLVYGAGGFIGGVITSGSPPD